MGDLSNTNPTQAAANGWVVDAGRPDAWETVSKAHNDRLGIMKSTKRMLVPGGWLYQTTTQLSANGEIHFAFDALVFVPDRFVV